MNTLFKLGDGIKILKTPESRVEVQIDEDVILKTHITGLEPDSVTWVKHQSQLEINDKEYVSTFWNLIKVIKRRC